MYERSLVTVDNIDNIQNLEDHEINISEIHKNQYLNAVSIYLGLMTDKPNPIERDEFLDEETQKKLLHIPEQDAERIIDFVSKVMTFIPEDALKDNKPLNPRHLKAYFSAAYKKQLAAGDDIDEELYIRLLGALHMEYYHIGELFDPVGTSIHAVQKYTVPNEEGNYYDGKWTARGAVGNMAINVIVSTWPIAESAEWNHKRSENLYKSKARYIEFQKDLLEELQQYKFILESLCKKYFSGRSVRASRLSLPVFVRSIYGDPPVSNNTQITELGPYIGGYAEGITEGYDNATGLPLTFTVLAYGWEEAKAPKDETGPLRSNTVYGIAGTALHEMIHEQAEFDINGRFEVEVNELLTDSLKELIQLRAHGIEFTSENFEHRYPTGYMQLTRFARELIIQGVVTEDDLIVNALNQDPRSFVRAIAKNAKTPEGARKLIYCMQRQDLILPLASTDIELAVERCIENPEVFFEQEFMKVVETFARGLPMYTDSILEFTSSSDPKFIQDQREVWAKELNKPVDEIDPNSIFLLLDPKTGVYHDRVVELYYQRKEANPYGIKGFLLNDKEFLTFITDPETGDYIPVFTDEYIKDELNNLETHEIVALLLSTERVAYKFLDHEIRPKNKADLTYFVAKMTERLYRGLSNIVSERYPNLNEAQKKSSVVELITNFVRNMRPLGKWTRYKDATEAIDEILGRISILTDSGLSDEEKADQMTIPQIIHYGHAVEFNREVVKKEADTIAISLRR